MNELTLEDVLIMHRDSIAVHGGIPGVKNEGYVLSALAQPSMAAFGSDLYPSLPEKAAALCFSFNKNHAFHDGNKRIAFQAANVFLLINGYRLVATNDEAVEMGLAVADGSMSREELVQWIAGRVQPMK